MALSKLGRRSRAPRVSLPNQQNSVVNIDGRRFTAALRKLSVNGGSVRLSKPLPEGTLAEITLPTNSGKVTSAIQLLTNDGHGTQGFRFLQLDPSTRSTLQTAIAQMRKQGLGDSPRLLQYCTDAARFMVQLARTRIS